MTELKGLRQRAEEGRRAARRRNRRVALLIPVMVLLAGAGAFVALSGEQGGPSVRQTGGDSAVPAKAERPRTATVSTSGDILIHSPVWYAALANGGGSNYDFAPMFAAIRPYVKGVDLSVCHLETPLTSKKPSGYPIFSTMPELAVGIRKAGWEACDTASNHTMDQGEAGVEETIRTLRKQGIAQTGSAITARAARRPLIMRANGIRIGLIAYTDFSNLGEPPSEHAVNLLPYDEPVSGKVERVRRDVARTMKAGADTVLVIIQWGTENSTVPNDSQVELARAVTKIPDVAAIAGQGPHVVQPVERINGKFVVFSSGNLLSNQSAAAELPAETQYGLIALFRFRSDEKGTTVKRLDYIPVWVRPGDYLIEPVGWGLKNDPANESSLKAAWESTVSIAGKGRSIGPIPRSLGD